MQKTSSAAYALIAALVLVTSACATPAGSGDKADNVASGQLPSEADLTPVNTAKVRKSLVVGVDNPHYVFSEDIVVAKQKGYFKQAGIENVSIKVLDEPIPGLIGGSLDLAAADTDAIFSAAGKSRSDLRYLGVNFGEEFIGLGVRAGIDTTGDLKGRTISAGQANSRTDFNLRQLLTENKVDLDDVKVVNTGGTANNRLSAVLAGTVDGASLQLRHRRYLEDVGGKFLLERTRAVPQSGWATDRLLKESPETVAAFLTAVLKARAYIVDPGHKDEVIGLMKAAHYEIPAEYAAAYAKENAPGYHTADAGFEVADMDKFVADSIKFKTAPAGTAWRELTDLVPLWRAQKELGIPLRPVPADLS
ncbi:ABC transporter substrate-binding protein [Streptomyces paradoxus]|uniref:ABC transporter substrate-binding protein n=1 Tax=Streptomyces paradoxus TaxID=66375 RepID=UPI0037D03BF6